jgi:hypothetical protein
VITYEEKMTIKDLGARIISVWEGLRPMTRKMIVAALQNVSGTAGPANTTPNLSKSYSYDAHADWELSRLLTALDEQAMDPEVRKNPEKLAEIRRMAQTCADVLYAQTESAEVFIQLAERALRLQNYNQVDKLADMLADRFSVGEICEISRQTSNGAIRALAQEALALMPIQALVPMLEDPLYSEIVRIALEQQAYDYESEDAQELLDELDMEGNS